MSSRPTFSLIVPTHNRLSRLRACLGGISALAEPRDDFQVIVVNDGGEKIPEADERAWKTAIDLSVLVQPNRGASAARNTGAAHARGEWLVFTDDDCVPEPNWLASYGKAIARFSHAAFGGTVYNGVKGNKYSNASECLSAYLNEYYHQPQGAHTQIPFFPSNNFAVRRQMYETVGGFDETMRHAEDRDFCARLAAAGVEMVLVPEARVAHWRTMDLVSFWQQHLQYGDGAVQYHANRKQAAGMPLQIEPLTFYSGMVRFPFRTARPAPFTTAFLLVVSQLANAIGFATASLKPRVVFTKSPVRSIPVNEE